MDFEKESWDKLSSYEKDKFVDEIIKKNRQKTNHEPLTTQQMKYRQRRETPYNDEITC